MHLGTQRSCAWQGLHRGGIGIFKRGELLAPKCSLGALGAHWVPELAGRLAGWLAEAGARAEARARAGARAEAVARAGARVRAEGLRG